MLEKLRIGISGYGGKHLKSQYSKMEAKGPRVQDLSLLYDKNCPENVKQQNMQKRKKRDERKEKELIAGGGTELFYGGGRTEGGADCE